MVVCVRIGQRRQPTCRGNRVGIQPGLLTGAQNFQFTKADSSSTGIDNNSPPTNMLPSDATSDSPISGMKPPNSTLPSVKATPDPV